FDELIIILSTLSNSTASITGKVGCECADVSSAIQSVARGSCLTPEGENGVLLTVSGPCVPYSYGSGGCLQYEMMYDPVCQITDESYKIPDYCTQPWCYVDRNSCLATSERVYRSIYFHYDSGVDLIMQLIWPHCVSIIQFYSYTTCESSQEGMDSFFFPQNPLGGANLMTGIPAYYEPYHYKRNPDSDLGEILISTGSEYYDNTIPWEGATLDYFRSLMSIADGDFGVTYTHGSRAAKKIHPKSSFTAVVQDVKDGLVDLGIGPFWVTGERLQMTTFTVPVDYDRTLLVIERPGETISLRSQVEKVIAPFSPGVWGLLIVIIAFTALLSVWFIDVPRRGRRPGKKVYARWTLDAFLEKGTFFCSAGVEQNLEASLPSKLLMFGMSFLLLPNTPYENHPKLHCFALFTCQSFQGFAFFILIVVSAYVANLAAFLTRNSIGFEGTIESAIAARKRICAFAAIKNELEARWDKAIFVFDQTGGDNYYGMIADYDSGKCDMLAVGDSELVANPELVNELCARNLVVTNSLILENALAFPINPLLAAGLSYWMYQGEKYNGISLRDSVEKYNNYYNRQPICNVEFSAQDLDGNEYARIEVPNLFFPVIFFLGCAALAVVLQLLHRWALKTEKSKSYMGRQSTIGRR
ncbi:hypothetical protein ACHAXR_004282, partial [Thalassiosira sp. AJA248-18]